jgi:hypothetical protein
VAPPAVYDLDALIPEIKTPICLNDHLDDCVIAARAHHTLRLAYVTGAPILNITDNEGSKTVRVC